GNPVIVIPARVARLIDRLIGLNPDFADWWDRLLRHEHDFHLGEHPEHDGHRHDEHAAGLVAELKAATVVPVAFDGHGNPVALDTATRAALRELLDGLDERGQVFRQEGRPGHWLSNRDDYAIAVGDAELADLLARAGRGTITVTHLIDLAHGRVVVSTDTASRLMDRLPAGSHAALARVVAHQAGNPAATPEQAWQGLDPVEVYTGLLMGQIGAADTLIMTWEYLVETLAEQPETADTEIAAQATSGLDQAEKILDTIGEFLGHTGTDTGDLDTRHAAATELLATLRGQLATVAEAQRRYAGLTTEQRAQVIDDDAVVGGYQGILDTLTGDPAQRREQLLDLMDTDAGEIAGQLAGIRADLAALPQIPVVTDLITTAEQLQARYERLHGDESGEHGEHGGAVADGVSDAHLAVFGKVAKALAPNARPLGRSELPFGARDPPVRVLSAKKVRAALVKEGLTKAEAQDLIDRMVAFGWKDGAVVMLDNRVAELAAIAAWLDGWFDELLNHEQGHLDGHWDTAGKADHDHDAQPLVNRWRAAQQARDQAAQDRKPRRQARRALREAVRLADEALAAAGNTAAARADRDRAVKDA
ncbi:hypothetical protein, partial [Pseudonocardia acaciae]|uniref:hypothetical protein n=1 Tax=Pseudonocardia acaciae TaxID=551276 RepID=UPI00056BB2D8